MQPLQVLVPDDCELHHGVVVGGNDPSLICVVPAPALLLVNGLQGSIPLSASVG